MVTMVLLGSVVEVEVTVVDVVVITPHYGPNLSYAFTYLYVFCFWTQLIVIVFCVLLLQLVCPLCNGYLK